MHINSCVLAAAFAAYSSLASAADSAPTVGQLSQIQGETMLIQARAAQAAAKAQLLKNQAEAGDEPAAGTNFSAPVIDSELPTVTGISTSRGRLSATFLYPNGTTTKAAAGDLIPGGYRVTEVSLERAVVTRGDRRIPLQSGVAQRSQQQATVNGGLPGQAYPGMPPANLVRPQ